MAKETISAEDAEMMILEGVNDVDTEKLGKMLAIMTGDTVTVIDDDTLEIETAEE